MLGLSLAVYLFLYIPLIVVIVYSFNASRVQSGEWGGFTLDWYNKLLHNETLLNATLNSLIIGVAAAAIATVLGTLAGLALHRYKLRLLPALVLAATLLLSIFQPGRAWVHALLVGLSIPGGIALAKTAGLPSALGMDMQLAALLPVALPAVIGAVAGVLLRRVSAAPEMRR